ncbi:ParA family protein [Lacticaseibacillus paracasei]|uniref:ParA family protein n=1 Tax=Lacticaseibacillus paracasei TaxID=1597 RepID=UPI00101FBE1D|nr:AAA family ATPase [Lacticaseibacillus paracasei]MBX4167028.1 AAA family ATPase [Lacticaseibacillus paracasei]MCZ2763934.1 AAA family ATPase [Lacticaseibacillus paracasei]MCZ2772352.1 AAA family ATPase [Lacticaseibacillus paracasei]MDB7807519.1 AAA family ATPase [Lacticaseibacillus paracasei]MSC31460.1 AAA family ATPase [Lacticaseibacillus paracasei]
MTATVLSFANFKGGVGKTSTTALVAWSLAKAGHKVCMIDFDPQANLTALMIKTYASLHNDMPATIKTSLMTAITEDKPLKDIMISISDNLDLVPNAVDFSIYGNFLTSKYPTEKEQVTSFRPYVDALRDAYDFIFIDVPPTLQPTNDTAFYACDQLIVVLQTQERALTGAEQFVKYMQSFMIDRYNAPLDILGILPVLTERRAPVDEAVLQAAIAEFGTENIFEHHILIQSRIKRYDMTGITDNPKDMWDKKVHNAYKAVAEEMIQRLEAN